jgi:hypothetical protein
MNRRDARQTEVTQPNRTGDGFSKRLLAALWSLAHPASPQHVGMFAGSLLHYSSWAQPKVPH